MNILAIDYGQRNIGLAWMQEGLDVVLPYGVIQNDESGLGDLQVLIKKEGIQKIVLGLPLDLNEGTENMNTKRVREFGAKLEKQTGLLVDYIDERLSSFEADQMGGDASRDEKAAMVILETYKSQI